jgi:hypothetical protein
VEVQALALEHGFKPESIKGEENTEFPIQPDSEFYDDLITEAIEHLQSLTIEGLWWGYSESGDFGLWPVDCDQCNGTGYKMLSRYYGLAPDCPDCKGTGNTLQIKQ